MKYLIASVKHTAREHLHVQFWAADECGYRLVEPGFGRYSVDTACKLNDGRDCIAVPEECVLPLLIEQPHVGFYDSPGNVLANSRTNWEAMLAHSLSAGRRFKPYPMWRGRRKRQSDLQRMCWGCYETYPKVGHQCCPRCGRVPAKGERSF